MIHGPSNVKNLLYFLCWLRANRSHMAKLMTIFAKLLFTSLPNKESYNYDQITLERKISQG